MKITAVGSTSSIDAIATERVWVSVQIGSTSQLETAASDILLSTLCMCMSGCIIKSLRFACPTPRSDRNAERKSVQIGSTSQIDAAALRSLGISADRSTSQIGTAATEILLLCSACPTSVGYPQSMRSVHA